MIQQTVNADRPAALNRICLWPVSKSIPDDLRLSLRPRLPYLLTLHIHDTVVGYNSLLTLVAFVHQYPLHPYPPAVSTGEHSYTPPSLISFHCITVAYRPLLWCQASCSFELISLDQSLIMGVVLYADTYRCMRHTKQSQADSYKSKRDL